MVTQEGAPLSSAERITQLEKIASEQAEHFDNYVAYDQTTQLPNRSLFADRVTQALHRARREGRVMAVISLGLHDLRRVTDTLGLEASQLVLRETATRLKTMLRETDTISLMPDGKLESTLSTLSEGEYGLLLPSLEDTEVITWIVKRLFDSLQLPFEIEGHKLSISTHIGVGVYPEDGVDATVLIQNAAVSRYYAEKHRGENTVEFYSEEINRVSRRQLQLESELSAAIDNVEFDILYQPKIDLDTSAITGFEALLRWNHPVNGVLTPYEFIEIAERTRLINLIGDWVLEQACGHIQELSKHCGRNLSLAVNLSPVQFSQPDLAQRVQKILADTGLDPTLLELELTESCLLENVENTFKCLGLLQSQGINISIDDFGTGYSGLSYLRTLPVNILKVDRSFVADIASNPNDKAIITAIISMASALDLKVVAEGVETSAQMETLKAMNCREAQGFLWSPAVSVQSAKELLEN